MMKKGYALLTVVFVILALAALVVSIVALMFIGSRSSVDEYRYSKAFYMAEAGRVYGTKQVIGYADWTQSVGLPVTKSFGGGCFTVSVTTQTADSITLLSTGLLTEEGKNYQRAVRIILNNNRWGFANNYVIAWGGGGSGTTTAQIGSNVNIEGDIQISGNINIGSNTTIGGNATASGNITGYKGGVSGTYEGGSILPTSPPRLVTTYYDNQILLAQNANAGNQTWGSRTISGDTYIYGNLTINNNANINVSGSARVVVSGTVTMNNNVTIGNHLVLISNGLIDIKNNANIGTYCTLFSSAGFSINNNLESGEFVAGAGTSFLTPGNFDLWNNAVIYGFIFCGGTMGMHNNTTFYGNIVANSVSNISNNSQLHLSPNLVDYGSIEGLEGGTDIRLGSWEEVF